MRRTYYREEERVFTVKKFPNIEKDDWIALNKERVDEELKAYEDLFEEPLKTAFQEIMTEYIYLQSVMEDVAQWKDNFVRFIALATSMSEGETNQSNGGATFHRGRLSLIKEVLEWF